MRNHLAAPASSRPHDDEQMGRGVDLPDDRYISTTSSHVLLC